VGGRVGFLALCLSTLFSIGCGSSSSSSSTAQVRILEAAVGAPSVNILVDGATVASNLGYGSATAYLTVKSGSRHVQAVPVGGGSPIIDQTLSLTASSNQTLLITGTSSSTHTVVLTDGGTTATTGDGHVRVFNASSTMVASDVYIVPPGTSLVGVAPVTKTTPLGFDGDTDYQLVPVGNYEVFLTVPNTTTVNLGTGPLNLSAGTNSNQTVVAFDATAGGFAYILFTDQ
jgi:hypothetical protein